MTAPSRRQRLLGVGRFAELPNVSTRIAGRRIERSELHVHRLRRALHIPDRASPSSLWRASSNVYENLEIPINTYSDYVCSYYCLY
jgi:hypothetical protein